MENSENNYRTVEDAARQLGVSSRTVRNLCEEHDWFGGKLGTSATWVLTQEEVDKMHTLPRRGPGRPRKPLIPMGENSNE